MQSVSPVRQAIARLDINSPAFGHDLPPPGNQRQVGIVLNRLDLIVHGTNAFTSGTPLALVAAPLTTAYGFGKLVLGFLATATSAATENHAQGAALRRSGLTSMAAGVAGFFPVVGNWANGTLAVATGIESLNARVTPEELAERTQLASAARDALAARRAKIASTFVGEAAGACLEKHCSEIVSGFGDAEFTADGAALSASGEFRANLMANALKAGALGLRLNVHVGGGARSDAYAAVLKAALVARGVDASLVSEAPWSGDQARVDVVVIEP